MFAKRRMLIRAIAVAAALLTSPALALSCMPFGAIDAFEAAQAADARFAVVYGALRFDESKAPKGYDEAAASAKIAGRVIGKALSRTGFDTDFAGNVTVDIACAGPWCGQVSAGDHMLMFLEQVGTGYRLSVGACTSYAFSNPNKALLDQMTRCLNGRCGNKSR